MSEGTPNEAKVVEMPKDMNRKQRRDAGIQDYAVIVASYKLAEGETPSSVNHIVVRIMAANETEAVGAACSRLWQSAAAQPKTADGMVAISLICGAQTMPWGVFQKRQEEAKRDAELNPPNAVDTTVDSPAPT